MQNLPFVIWMLGFPLMVELEQVLIVKATGKCREDKRKPMLYVIVLVVMWFGIGYKLYRP